MSWPAQPQWSDEDILTALDMRDHEGATYAAIAKVVGRSRSACIGVLSRVDAETDRADVSPHLNGTMPRGWWCR